MKFSYNVDSTNSADLNLKMAGQGEYYYYILRTINVKVGLTGSEYRKWFKISLTNFELSFNCQGSWDTL